MVLGSVGRRVASSCVFAAFLAVAGCNSNRLGAAGGPDISVSPESLTFTTSAFTGGGASATLTVIVSNEGKGVLHVNDIKFAPNTSTELAWQFGGSSNIPLDLGPSAWVAVQVVYTPTDYLSDSGTLLVFSNDPDEGIVEIPIVTPILGPAIACTPNPAVFIQAPGTPTNRTINCSNSGTAPITVTGFATAAWVATSAGPHRRASHRIKPSRCWWQRTPPGRGSTSSGRT